MTAPNSGKLRRLTPSLPISEQENPKLPSSQGLPKLPALPSEARDLRILDFDIENRPLSYWFDGRCTAEVTAIAASWLGEARVYCWLLGEQNTLQILANFRQMYDTADIVTGHYIKRHDLPLINAAMVESGFPPLGRKLVSDTKMDLTRLKDLSGSQEALAAMFNLPHAKHHMTQSEWREANRLTQAGLDQTRKRVIDDVKQHKALRARLIEAQVLGQPTWWSPSR